jgi:hypothetical protein
MREFTAPRYPGPKYFEGACAAIKKVGPGDFMVCPGDIDPPGPVRAALDKYFGSNYWWAPVIGNHEAETPADMEWLRQWGEKPIPGLVRRGPPGTETTTFSFNHRDAHFVVLNQYYDGRKDTGTKGEISARLLTWLEEDLSANTKQPVFVIGHEPIVPLPDMDNGRLRHEKDSLNAYPESANAFLKILQRHNVVAYLCGHTHNTSITNLNGVWQIDVGHARGKGDPGAKSTFVRMQVDGLKARADFYRAPTNGGPYGLTRSVDLHHKP